jgi:hypothetical protein
MSFIDGLGSIVKGVGGFLASNSIGSSLAKTAILGYALNKVSKSINNQANENKLDPTPITLNPDTTNSVPVLYGTAYVKGMITDAYLTSDNKTMWYCITLCEKTGNLINGNPSEISFQEVYFNGLRLDFKADGYTVDLAYDEEGNSTDDFSGLIQIYPFSGSSTDPVGFSTEPTRNTTNAYTLFPEWNTNDNMSDLVFALIKTTYNPEKNINSLGNWEFKLSNTMSQPGDVLFDYMTNTRYGAGINEQEIYKI